MKKRIKRLLLLLCIVSMGYVAASQEKNHQEDSISLSSKAKLRSAFRESLLEADTILEDIDPEEIELSLSSSLLRGSMPEEENLNFNENQTEKETEEGAEEEEEDIIMRKPTISSEELSILRNTKIRKNIGLTIELNENTVNYSNKKNHWENIRISFQILQSSTSSATPQFYNTLSSITPLVSSTWSNILNVRPIQGPLFPTSTSCGSIDIPLHHLSHGVADTDTLVYISAAQKNDVYCQDGIMESYATVCNMDQNQRPIVSHIVLCPNVDIKEVLMTQVGKVLGLSSSLFQYYRNPTTFEPYGTTVQHVTCVDGSSLTLNVPNMIQPSYQMIQGQRRFFEVVSETVLQVVRNHFNCQVLSGARLDNSVLSEGCFGTDWDHRYFLNNERENISALSLALLEDSSWYRGNFQYATTPSFGHGAGCSFLQEDCQTNKNQQEFFCSVKDTNVKCTADHTAKAECDTTTGMEHVDEIFEVLKYRGRGISTLEQTVKNLEEEDSLYHCPMRTKNVISCLTNEHGEKEINAAEVFGKQSKCFNTLTASSICLQAHCNKHTKKLEVTYNQETFICDKANQIIELSQDLLIQCPKLELICPDLICPANCSGKGMCDYSLVNSEPICICDDPFDTTDGCWNNSSYINDSII